MIRGIKLKTLSEDVERMECTTDMKVITSVPLNTIFFAITILLAYITNY